MSSYDIRITLNEQMDALVSMERRELLYELQKRPQDSDILENLEPANGESTETEFEIEMHHVHLPKLEQYGFVDWEPESDTVRRGPRFDDLEPMLDTLSSHRATVKELTEP